MCQTVASVLCVRPGAELCVAAYPRRIVVEKGSRWFEKEERFEIHTHARANIRATQRVWVMAHLHDAPCT